MNDLSVAIVLRHTSEQSSVLSRCFLPRGRKNFSGREVPFSGGKRIVPSAKTANSGRRNQSSGARGPCSLFYWIKNWNKGQVEELPKKRGFRPKIQGQTIDSRTSRDSKRLRGTSRTQRDRERLLMRFSDSSRLQMVSVTLDQPLTHFDTRHQLKLIGLKSIKTD
jgi:hypothetical protein